MSNDLEVTINGERATIPVGITVTQLLSLHSVKMPDMVSVELNGEILERSAFDSTSVNARDQIEFLYFMGGGAAGRPVDCCAALGDARPAGNSD